MRFDRFRVQNFRNIKDSGWIKVTSVTAFVGQNEAGKSNLFEALYALNPYVDDADYDSAEDWPVDDWMGRQDAEGKPVAQAVFELTPDEITSLFATAGVEPEEGAEPTARPPKLEAQIDGWYGYSPDFCILEIKKLPLDEEKASAWMKLNAPKFVFVRDYEMSGTQVELPELKQRLDQQGGKRSRLSNEDQTILVLLDLARINLGDFIQKGNDQEGRTVRSFDKRAASAYLTQQFQKLWSQKDVEFEIDIDGPTLNIFAKDTAIGFPVRLKRRSTGFRWYVSFAWKFTHASRGDFKNCIILLEEPGIHLHHSGQRDLMQVFERLSATNTILYTTHLASLVDMANPERIRIVESRDRHLAIMHGVVSSQKAPMAVIEMALGLTSDLGGMLGNRKVLIVEGGIDALVLSKLSGVLRASGRPGLSEQIYLWPAETASKVPGFAAFAVGQKWDAAALLDSDKAGHDARKKIANLLLKENAKEQANAFRVLMLNETSGLDSEQVEIEDLLSEDFFRECVNDAYGIAIKAEDIASDTSLSVTKRVESVLKSRHDKEIDKKKVLSVMFSRFDNWKKIDDLPPGVADAAAKLFGKINATFGLETNRKK